MSEVLTAIMAAKKHMGQPAKKKRAMYGKYADLDAVLEVVEKPLVDQGVLITQCVRHNEFGPYLETKLTHLESDDALTSEYPLRAKSLDDPQQLGGSLTYARRYALVAMLSIVADEDDDGNTSSGKNREGKKKSPPKNEGVSEKEVKEALSTDANLDEAKVDKLITGYTRCGFESNEIVPEIKALLGRDIKQLSELTEAEYKAAVGHARQVKSGDAERKA